MKKIIFGAILLLIGIILGYITGLNISNSAFSKQYPLIEKLNTGKEVRVCNNTNIFLRGVSISEENIFLDIPIGECSIYQELSNKILNLVPDVTTKEDEIFYRYETNYGDVIAGETIPRGKYTIYINDLLKNEFKLIEYFRGVEFELEKE